MNDVEISKMLRDYSKSLSAFSVVLAVEHSGISLTLNSIASQLEKISAQVLAEDEVYHGFDWLAIRDALADVRPDLSLKIDRYLRRAEQ